MTILINPKEKALIDSVTGELFRPSCWETLIPYHSYLIGRGHPGPAQALLEKVFSGEKVISKMTENYQKHFQNSDEEV